MSCKVGSVLAVFSFRGTRFNKAAGPGRTCSWADLFLITLILQHSNKKRRKKRTKKSYFLSVAVLLAFSAHIHSLTLTAERKSEKQLSNLQSTERCAMLISLSPNTPATICYQNILLWKGLYCAHGSLLTLHSKPRQFLYFCLIHFVARTLDYVYAEGI